MATEDLLHSEISGDIIDAFYRVYNALRYGFLESAYSAGMERELRKKGRRVALQCPVDVIYDGVVIAQQRLDMVVDEKVVVEIKSTYALHPIAERQLFSYLRSTRLEVGLILHFGPQARFKRITVAASTKHPFDPKDPLDS